MLKFKTVRSTFAYLSSSLLNEVGLSLFRYFEVGLRVCDIVVKKFTFAISSPDEFLYLLYAVIHEKEKSKDHTLLSDYRMSVMGYADFRCFWPHVRVWRHMSS